MPKEKKLPFLRALQLSISQPLRDRMLRELIRGKRVLIIGSGPSAKELNCIPEDVIVMACNGSPSTLIEKNLPTQIHLYLVNKAAFENYGQPLEALLKKITISTLASRTPAFIKKIPDLRVEKVILDRATANKDPFYLKKLLNTTSLNDLRGNSERYTSTGVSLLQYALYYQAKEIYLAGIDLPLETGTQARVTSPKTDYEKAHHETDQNFLRWVHGNFKNVFCTTAQSPLTKLFPFKSLD